VWHYKATGGAGIDEDLVLAAIAANYAVAFANVQAEISPDYGWNLFQMWKRNVALGRWDGVASLPVASVFGTGAGDNIAHGVAAVGRIITDLARRQGRTFLPGLEDTNVVDGLLTAGMALLFLDYLADFAADVAGSGFFGSWITYNTDPLSPFFETAAIAAGGVIANLIVGYQRRRKPLVGL
jgi:hypothetical protein